MAKPNIAVGLGEILPHIEISTFVLLILLYPGEPVELPEVLEKKATGMPDPTDKAMEVESPPVLILSNPKVERLLRFRHLAKTI